MIVTNREHALDYLGLNERLDKALRFIADTDIAALPEINVAVDARARVPAGRRLGRVGGYDELVLFTGARALGEVDEERRIAVRVHD